jgi:hypothetical protein
MSMAGEAFHSGHRGQPAPRSRFFGGLGSGGSFAESLARESTGVLVHSGFGGQLLSVSLGEGGVGLSQGENDHNPSFALSSFKAGRGLTGQLLGEKNTVLGRAAQQKLSSNSKRRRIYD